MLAVGQYFATVALGTKMPDGPISILVVPDSRA